MSVLINGMEMPKCCEECVAGAYEYNDNDERCFVCGFIKSQHPWECEHVEIDGIDTTKARADFCPLIEVPPHGRLIDADFEEQHYTSMTTDPTPDVTEQDKRNSLIIIEALRMAKTVIEAEE